MLPKTKKLVKTILKQGKLAKGYTGCDVLEYSGVQMRPIAEYIVKIALSKNDTICITIPWYLWNKIVRTLRKEQIKAYQKEKNLEEALFVYTAMRKLKGDKP